MSLSIVSRAALTVLVWGLGLWGQAVAQQGIYTCVDAKGRKITADRPIAECTDRTQTELSSTGLVKRQIGPTLTAQEQVVQEEKEKQAAEMRARQAEEKRRDRALALRYPNRAVHDSERAIALTQIDDVINASAKRTKELMAQRKSVATEFEFYAADPSKAPASLKRSRDDIEASLVVQQRFVAEQQQEKKRVNQRFDEELSKLQTLWPAAAASTTSKPAG